MPIFSSINFSFCCFTILFCFVLNYLLFLSCPQEAYFSHPYHSLLCDKDIIYILFEFAFHNVFPLYLLWVYRVIFFQKHSPFPGNFLFMQVLNLHFACYVCFSPFWDLYTDPVVFGFFFFLSFILTITLCSRMGAEAGRAQCPWWLQSQYVL